MTKTTFRYRLDAVKKKYRWDADLARQDLAQAARLVDQAQERVRKAEAVLAAAEEAVRQRMESEAGFDPVAYSSLLAYAAVQQQALEVEKEALKKAQRVHQQTLTHHERTDRQCKVLDKHENRLREYAAEEDQRQQQLEADELCLLRWKYER